LASRDGQCIREHADDQDDQDDQSPAARALKTPTKISKDMTIAIAPVKTSFMVRSAYSIVGALG
jgi:hypothetical protein